MFMPKVNACLYQHHAFDTCCERTHIRTRQSNIRLDNQNSRQLDFWRKQDFDASRIFCTSRIFASVGFWCMDCWRKQDCWRQQDSHEDCCSQPHTHQPISSICLMLSDAYVHARSQRILIRTSRV